MKMDFVALVRDQWGTLGVLLAGLGGALLAASRGEWLWAVISLALVITAARVLQLEGWVMQEGVTGGN